MRYFSDILQTFKGRVSGVKVKPVDTTGAGDAFVGGILSNLASDLNILKVNFSRHEKMLLLCFICPKTELSCIVRLTLMHSVQLCIIMCWKSLISIIVNDDASHATMQVLILEICMEHAAEWDY